MDHDSKPASNGSSNPTPVIDFQSKDEIDFSELWSVLVTYRKTILISALVSSFIFLVVSLTMPNMYRSTTLLSPVTANPNGIGQKMSGISSLIGVSLGAADGGRKTEAMATLTSRQFITQFIKDNDLKPFLFYNDWDSENKKWMNSGPGFIERVRNFFLGAPETTKYDGMEALLPGEPSMWLSYYEFSDILAISEDKKTGLVTLSIVSHDPVLSSSIANKLIDTVEGKLRNDFINKSENSVKFLETQVKEMELIELRKSAFDLMQQHIQNIALSQAGEPYAFKVIDPAVVAEKKSSPKRLVLIIIGFIIGLIFGILIALLFNWKRRINA